MEVLRNLVWPRPAASSSDAPSDSTNESISTKRRKTTTVGCITGTTSRPVTFPPPYSSCGMEVDNPSMMYVHEPSIASTDGLMTGHDSRVVSSLSSSRKPTTRLVSSDRKATTQGIVRVTWSSSNSNRSGGTNASL